MTAETTVFNEHSTLRFEHGALVFPMPVECYDRLMDTESLPRGACYNGPRGALEVDAVPNGRYHDPRAYDVARMLESVRRLSGVTARIGATAPIEGGEDDRRHPDAHLFVSPAKLAALRVAARPAPIPDLAVEIDITPLSSSRSEARLAAYARLRVPELWMWQRTAGTEAHPQGRATFLAAAGKGWRRLDESAGVPGMRPDDLDRLMSEPDDLARADQADELPSRLAPGFGRR